MPNATVRGASIRYEVLGERGAWVARTPGRAQCNGLHTAPRASPADAGFRVLIHDRRNCGGSDVLLEGELAEHATGGYLRPAR